MEKVDGYKKITGEEIFGADQAPEDALWLRAVRSRIHAQNSHTPILKKYCRIIPDWSGF